MSLSFDQARKLDSYRAILHDRGLTVCLTIERNPQPSDDELDEIADLCLEIQEAAHAMELLCARAVRWARRDAIADEAETDVQPAGVPSGTPATSPPQTTGGR